MNETGDPGYYQDLAEFKSDCVASRVSGRHVASRVSGRSCKMARGHDVIEGDARPAGWRPPSYTDWWPAATGTHRPMPDGHDERLPRVTIPLDVTSSRGERPYGRRL